MALLASGLSRTVAVVLLVCAYAAPGQTQRFSDYEQEERAPRYIASASDQNAAKPTPVPILKQVNRHNEDGSYTYGYEGADGSFKIETKLANGEVKGKYGYRDDTGKVRTIEYGANKYGFQPSGEGITVAPPTLVDESQEERRQDRPQSQGGRAPAQYRPVAQPAPVDYDYEEPAPAPAPQPTPAPYRAPAVRQPQLHTFAAASAPAIPRRPTSFAGAAPAPPVDRAPAQFSSGPAPQPPRATPEPQFQFSQTFQPHNQLQFSAPAPRKQYPAQQYQTPQYQGQQYQAPQYQTQQYPAQQQYSAPAPQPAFRPAPQPQRESFSMLDKLIQEYGLPQGGSAPLHDITFGSSY